MTVDTILHPIDFSPSVERRAQRRRSHQVHAYVRRCGERARHRPGDGRAILVEGRPPAVSRSRIREAVAVLLAPFPPPALRSSPTVVSPAPEAIHWPKSADSRACPPSPPPPRRSWPRCGRAGAARSTARIGCRAWSGSLSPGSASCPSRGDERRRGRGVAGCLARTAGNGAAGPSAHVDRARALMWADGVLPFAIYPAAGPWDAPPTGRVLLPAPPASERTPAQDAAGRDRRRGPVSRPGPGLGRRVATTRSAEPRALPALGPMYGQQWDRPATWIYHAAVAAAALSEVRIGTRPRRPAAGRQRRRAARPPR